VSVHRGGPAAHDSHVWGPHKHGIRWVQCQRCECLLHEPEAVEVCTDDPDVVRVRRERVFMSRLRDVAEREGLALYVTSDAHGLWQALGG
jgi:hypothetical protein